MAPTLEPFPTETEDFAADDRISFSKTADTHLLEAEDGTEWEWLARVSKWIPVTSEEDVEKQQRAYMVEGVDENAPAVDLRKRKAQDEEAEVAATSIKKQKAEPKERVNTAVYITSLPDDVDVEELHQVFSRYGVIAESLDSDAPRIKLYTNEEGDFKGEALIVYFRPESVQLAINMLDESDFRLGQQLPTGPMRVHAADASFKSQKDQPLKTDEAKKKGTTANRDRQKVIQKTQEMNNRLADWDDDDPQALPETSSRWDKVVVLKSMFTLAELSTDPHAISDIIEDVREECEKLGQIANITLFDLEAEGVVTVRFTDARAAQACIRAFGGRWFDKRQIVARTADGSERFRKSKGKKGGVKEGVEEEAERLEAFSRSIEED
ncbi:hypothetical protein LTR02_005743 [Friedmanniomyces endolithicus]|uniref:RRM domain-containing protein n=1 Tax=Rachicladosporium monterosium TaxID=1507873 RepID=A0ABR0L2B6_9PEZI|nr:hypothetical protein LTR94_001570 [Friedmanniomyces endolithicus]KAK5142401.1 hypothetical protein LTR32_005242 [Rachicladosporium monterosium]KAK0810284.1 hypothetical protein LTR59_002277 [Friedmanniomyces endolithicus]KAK0812033.1 hypothetical protein LTR38_003468 [Friedmanniomyces endolithicus]KAK0819532.1 hypothetical protein LTR75_002054 [Friedmanniomyces endolithicus]